MAVRRWGEAAARTKHGDLVVGLALFLLAIALRIYQIDLAPPGLNGDELYNLIDARTIGPGSWPVYFSGNHGREAFYFYLLALSLKLFGVSVFALRLPSVLLGGGTALLAYLVGGDMFGRPAGYVAAALVAVSFWPLMLSRMALRAISLTFLSTLTVYLLYRALITGRLRDWLLGGAALGLSLYTYIPARLFPLVILLWLAMVCLRRRKQLAGQYRAAVASMLLALLIFAPFGLYMVRNPEVVNQRIASMTNAIERTRAGEPEALAASIGGVLQMFSIKGDAEWRYHLAHAPVFDPVTSIFFYAGLVLCLWRAVGSSHGRPRQPEYALMLLWMTGMLAPVAVLNENPSFIRAAGAIVPIYLIAGIGVQGVVTAIQRRRPLPTWLLAFIVLAALAATLAKTWHDYFVVWTNNAQVRTVYHAGQAQLGRYLQRVKAPSGTRLFVANDYIYDSPTTLGLSLFTNQQVAWFAQENTLPVAGNAAGVGDAWYIVLAGAPVNAEFVELLAQAGEVEIVPYANGDEAFRLFRVAAGAMELEPGHEATMQFDNGLDLHGYDVPRSIISGDVLTVRLTWQIAAGAEGAPNQLTYAQVHLSDASGIVRARGEVLLGLPQAGWQSGDLFLQDVSIETPEGMLPGPAALAIGLRDESGEPLGVLQEVAGAPLFVRGRQIDDFTVTPEMTVFDDALALAGASFRPVAVPGTDLNVELSWVALQQPREDYRVRLALLDNSGDALVQQEFDLWPDVYPPSQWQPGETVSTLHGLRVPLDFAAPEPLALHLAVLPQDDATRPFAFSGAAPSLGGVELELRERLFEAPPVQAPIDAQFGNAIRLLGYDLDVSDARTGGEILLRLVWQAATTPDTNYTVFNHVVGSTGELLGQLDAPPVGEAWLTETWLPGEVVVEERRIPIFEEAMSGQARLYVGLYRADDLSLLPAFLGGEHQADDRVLLHEFQISGGS